MTKDFSLIPENEMREIIRTFHNRIEELEHAIITLASWLESGEWKGAREYISAILGREEGEGEEKGEE